MVHPFFDELRDPNTRLPDSRNTNGPIRDLPELYNFTHHGKPVVFLFFLCVAAQRLTHAELSIAPHLNSQLVPPHHRATLAARGLDFESPSFKPLTKDQMMARLD